MDAEAINQAHRDDDAGRPARLVAVATSGTAFGADHVATLHQVAPLTDRQVMVVMDNDPAGDTAAVRARDVLAAAGVDHAATTVPTTAKDASQLLQEQGPDAVRAAMADRRPLEDLVVDRVVSLNQARWSKDRDFRNITERFGTMDVAARAVAAMPTDQQHRQTMRLAEKLDLSLFRVMDKVHEHVDALPPKPPTPFVPAYPGDLGLPTPPTLHTPRTTPSIDPDPDTDPEQGGLDARTNPAQLPFNRPPAAISPSAADGISVQQGSVVTLEPTTEPSVVDADRVAPDVEGNIAPRPLQVHRVPDLAQLAEAESDQSPPVELLDAIQIGEQRPYVELPDAVLEERAVLLAADQRRLRQAIIDAADYADRAGTAAETGQGEAVNRLRKNIATLRQGVADIDTYREAIAETQQARAASQAAAEEAAAAQTELDGLGRFSGGRKAGLAARIDQLSAVRQVHQQRMVAAAKTAAALQTKVGTQQKQDRIRAAATAAQSNATELITHARETDVRTAQEARASVEQLRSEHQAIADEVTALNAEQQRRIEQTDPAREQARQQAYAARQAHIAVEDLDAADPYTQDPYAYDPTQDVPGVPDDASFER